VVTVGAILLILVMTAVCVLGTDLSARLQNVLIVFQVLSLMIFALVALVRVFSGDATSESLIPSLTWLNPFAAGSAALSGGLLLGVFAYWGWESAVNLTEETTDSANAPGKSAMLSTVLLLATYLSVAIAVVAFMGPDFLSANAEEEEFIFGLVATEVLGGWAWILLFSVATSAIASTQTTIIPASRTALSMARRRALPPSFGHIHRRYRTPDVSTWWVAVIAIVWYVVINLISENALFDSLTALSLLIAFYYALTGVACAIYYRHHLTASLWNLVFIGVGPVLGAAMLGWLLVLAIIDMSDPANSYSGQAWLGVGPPLVIGVLIFVVGVVLMFVWRAIDRTYWLEQPGVVDPSLLAPDRAS
jgi:amino acid transporter